MFASFLDSRQATYSMNELWMSSALSSVSALLLGLLLAVVGAKRILFRDPREPPRVISWVPYVGSALELGKDIHSFLKKYKAKFGGPIFTATILGQDNHFIVESEYITLPYRSLKEIDDWSLQKMFVARVLGVGKQLTEDCFNNTQSIHDGVKLYIKHFLKMESVEKSIYKSQLELTKVLADYPLNSERLPLYTFLSEAIFCMSTVPLVSERLRDKSLAHVFSEFERGAGIIFAGAPAFLAADSVRARETLYRIVASKEFHAQGTELIKERNEKLKLPREVIDRANLGVVWAVVGNSVPAIFWFYYHLLQDQTAYKRIEAEVRKVEGFPYTVQQLDEMEGLTSAFTEALRLYHSGWASRELKDNLLIELSGKPYVLRKGSRLMAWPGWLHHDPAIFENPDSYQPDRFLRNPTFKTRDGEIVKEPTRFFGGGNHLCPGRKFVQYEARAFAARLMALYDIELLADQEHPGIVEQCQGLGVNVPKNEIYVRMTERRRTES